MADLARALISKIVNEDDIATAVDLGVRPDWFEDEQHREVFEWMLAYHTRYVEVPTGVALKHQFPTFRFTATLEPYEYYVDRLRELREQAILLDTIILADRAIEAGDPKRAQSVLSQGLVTLGREVNALTDVDVVDWEPHFKRYQSVREHVGELTGIPTGFPGLDHVCGGYQSEQFVVFGGTPKQGKSFMMMRSAIAAQEHNKKVLFVSFEMSENEQTIRHHAMVSGVNATRLQHGRLSEPEMKQMERALSRRKNLTPFVISADTTSSTTLSSLAGKIDQHKPDIVFVDGIYLMENEVGANDGSPQAYTAISRGLKRLAQRAQIPLIGSTQALLSKMGKGTEITMNSLGWTSAWGQDADFIMGIERVADNKNLIMFRVVASRTFAPTEIGVSVDWDISSIQETELPKEESDGN